jgi:hypothetical protein
MAKITLENTTKHMIVLNIPGDPVIHVSIPGARPDAEQKLVNGVVEVDGDLVAQARKLSGVADNYFTEGHLREVRGGKKAEPKAA